MLPSVCREKCRKNSHYIKSGFLAKIGKFRKILDSWIFSQLFYLQLCRAIVLKNPLLHKLFIFFLRKYNRKIGFSKFQNPISTESPFENDEKRPKSYIMEGEKNKKIKSM